MIAGAKTKIVMLDDDFAFLEAVKAYINKKMVDEEFTLHFYSDIPTFNHHVTDYCYLADSPEQIINSYFSGEKSKANLALTLNDLADLPAMYIIDHELNDPNQNGINVCEELRTIAPTPCIMMLTSKIGAHHALDLHNNKVIDLYLKKESIQTLDSLINYLRKELNTISEGFHFDSPPPLQEVLENTSYLSHRDMLLREMPHIAYFSYNANGDMAVLTNTRELNLYRYQDGAFHIDG